MRLPIEHPELQRRQDAKYRDHQDGQRGTIGEVAEAKGDLVNVVE